MSENEFGNGNESTGDERSQWHDPVAQAAGGWAPPAPGPETPSEGTGAAPAGPAQPQYGPYPPGGAIGPYGPAAPGPYGPAAPGAAGAYGPATPGAAGAYGPAAPGAAGAYAAGGAAAAGGHYTAGIGAPGSGGPYAAGGAPGSGGPYAAGGAPGSGGPYTAGGAPGAGGPSEAGGAPGSAGPYAGGSHGPNGPYSSATGHGPYSQQWAYAQTDPYAYATYDTEPAASAPPRSHRLRNALVVGAVVLFAAGGGLAVGRVSATHSTASASPPPISSGGSGGSSLLPGSSGGSGLGNGFGLDPGGAFGGQGGSNNFGGLFGGLGGSSGTGGSTGVGAGGGSLNASSIAAKVDPALVDVNVVLGYENASAAGTGIVLTSNGEVLTNNHVVQGATSIKVTDIGNGRTYTAHVVGTDASADVAVIQLENASGLATANLGSSSSLDVGQAVLSIGNAGGTGGTPSTAAGSVVALNQSITATDDSGGDSEQLSGLVETNAPIQPGDSGGPLVNSAGQVEGMDTAASSGNTYQSASTEAYAIPIDTALSIAQQIEAGQASSTVHIGEAAFLGVEVETTTSSGGATIQSVIPNTPAASAGLAAGDVIVSLNGQTVSSPSDLSSLMAGHHPGDQVTVGYTNASGQHTVTLTLTSGPPA